MAITALSIGASSFVAAGGVTAIATGTLAAFSMTSFLVNTAIGVALYALSPKPSTGQGANRGYQVTTRGSARDHQIVYGKARVGGVVVYDNATGTNNKFLHRVLAFTGHEIEAFSEIYINDSKVTDLESDGNVKEVTDPDGSTSNRYDGKIRINKHLGSPNQTADSDLVSEVQEWTNDHRLREVSYLYVRFKFDQDAFPNGVPDVTALIKGKKVYDPRDVAQSSSDESTWTWSDNPALCLRDYISQDYGLGEGDTNIDDDLVEATADVCDEATSVTGNTRYTCNGAFTTGSTPYDNINSLITSMGGLVWYSQGKWRMKAATYVAPTLTLTEDDLRSNIQVATRHSRRDNFNTVKGTFRGEESNWQVTDYPEVTNSAFVSVDGGQESVLDLDLPFTDNSAEARRIALIALERNRQQLTVNASFGMRAFKAQVGDIVSLSVDRFGWTQKEFEVVSWTFGLAGEDSLDLQVQMTLREISESVFDEINDGIVYERDNTNLLSPFEVPSVGISATATTQSIREKLTNIIKANITSGRPEAIDYVEVEFKESSESDYTTIGSGELGLYRVVDVDTGTYDFRARAVNSFGVRGEWEYQPGVDANGLLEPPSDVEDFSGSLSDGSVHLSWSPVPDLDLSYYRLRLSAQSGGGNWSDAITVVDKIPRPATGVTLPSKPGTYHIRAYDKTGIASGDYTSFEIPESDFPSLNHQDTLEEAPTFSGTKTDCSVDTGSLIITDPSSGPSEAEYEFSDYIEVYHGSGSTTKRSRVRIDVESLRRDNSSGLFDDLPGLFDDLPGLFDDLTSTGQFADTTVETYVATTDDDPSGTPTWSNWKRITSGEYNARAFKFKVILKSSSDQVTPSIDSLKAVVDHE